MARKKMSKRTKRTVKSNTPATLIKHLEKSLEQTPLKLVKLINKEMTLLKKKQDKLKISLDKISVKIRKQEKRFAAINNKAPSTLSKKQAKAAQQKLNETLKIQSLLNQQWEKTALPLEQISKQHAKYIALNKHLESFDKDWEKQAKAISKNNNKEIKKSGKSNTSKEKTPNNTGKIEPLDESVSIDPVHNPIPAEEEKAELI